MVLALIAVADFAQAPFAEFALLHLSGEGFPRDAVVFDETRQLHTGIEQGRHDLPESVVPTMGDVVGELGLGRNVRAVVVVDQRLDPLEVGEVDGEGVGPPLVHRPEHRVALANEQPPSRAKQRGNHLSPAGHIGQPAQRTDPGVDHIEVRGRQHVQCLVHV